MKIKFLLWNLNFFFLWIFLPFQKTFNPYRRRTLRRLSAKKIILIIIIIVIIVSWTKFSSKNPSSSLFSIMSRLSQKKKVMPLVLIKNHCDSLSSSSSLVISSQEDQSHLNLFWFSFLFFLLFLLLFITHLIFHQLHICWFNV